MKLKEKILEKYKSIREFCIINDISSGTINKYIYGKDINNVKEKTLTKLCNALDCNPKDIGFTNDYWYSVTKNRKDRVYTFQIK